MGECWRKLRQKFPRITVPSTKGPYKLTKKVRSTASPTDKKASKNADSHIKKLPKPLLT
jgi:hypothetical protein